MQKKGKYAAPVAVMRKQVRMYRDASKKNARRVDAVHKNLGSMYKGGRPTACKWVVQLGQNKKFVLEYKKPVRKVSKTPVCKAPNKPCGRRCIKEDSFCWSKSSIRRPHRKNAYDLVLEKAVFD